MLQRLPTLRGIVMLTCGSAFTNLQHLESIRGLLQRYVMIPSLCGRLITVSPQRLI